MVKVLEVVSRSEMRFFTSCIDTRSLRELVISTNSGIKSSTTTQPQMTIPICEALLAYLKNKGNISLYWEVLGKNGIDRNRLASYERKITEEPYYLPHTIGDFENYLKILK